MRIGLIVNPIAGLGGRVGLKGSDGLTIQRKARLLGAKPEAGTRAAAALRELAELRDRLEILTYPAEMGEDILQAAGFKGRVIGEIQRGLTTGGDTRRAAEEMVCMGVDLLLFAGGDGTARDIYDAIGLGQPVVGIPAGVKIHSAVFGTHPPLAGELAYRFLERGGMPLQEREVMDVDEAALREGRVSAKLYGFLNIPYQRRLVQGRKAPSPSSEAAVMHGIAQEVAELMESGILYVLGAGTTTRAVATHLGQPKTLMGIDILANRVVVATDVTEAEILALIADRPARVIVAPIGGQGFILGRGNQQISPKVLRLLTREDIIVISTPEKLHALRGDPLLVDSGDPGVDRALGGYVSVITGYRERIVYRVAC
jgi:predicted polyphosphate/ATP-dependent NAD kinase